MGYKFFINEDKDTILITLEDEKYKMVVAKVGNIKKNDNDEIEFDMELPENCKEYYDDSEFTDQISLAVGDIVTKAINKVWSENAQEVLSLLESKTSEYFTKYNYIPPEGETFISLFGKKGFVISEDELNSYSHAKSLIMIDEGSDLTKKADYLLDIIPSVKSNRISNLTDSGFITKPLNVKKEKITTFARSIRYNFILWKLFRKYVN